jgi:hypothetical protein
VTPTGTRSVATPIPVVYLQKWKIKIILKEKVNILPAFNTGNIFFN